MTVIDRLEFYRKASTVDFINRIKKYQDKLNQEYDNEVDIIDNFCIYIDYQYKYVIQAQREDLLEVLCDYIFEYHEFPSSLIHDVIENNFIKVFRILISKSIPLNVENINAHPLYIAIRYDNYIAMELILNKGVKPDGLYNPKSKVSSQNITPLMYAAQYCKDTRIIHELLNRGANGALKDNKNRTAFDYLNLPGRDGLANVELRDNPEIFDLLKNVQDPKAKIKANNDQTSIF